MCAKKTDIEPQGNRTGQKLPCGGVSRKDGDWVRAFAQRRGKRRRILRLITNQVNGVDGTIGGEREFLQIRVENADDEGRNSATLRFSPTEKSPVNKTISRHPIKGRQGKGIG